MSWPLLFWYLQAALTPVIAIVAVSIAYQQHQTNKLKVRLDLFDRRFNVFLKVRGILSSVSPEGQASIEEFLKFRSGAAEAYFLFGQEMEDYLDEVYQHGRKLATADLRNRMPREEQPEDYDPKKVADEIDKELGWLMNQLPEVKARFKTYLDVSKL
jgi:hypothetical protein